MLIDLMYLKEKNEAIEFLHKFSNDVIKDRQSFFTDGVISYTQKKKMAMLDLMLAAKFKGADITDEGIREEVDTFMFAVSNSLQSVRKLHVNVVMRIACF